MIMKYELVKDMFPEYLKADNIIIENNKITIYFSSKRNQYNCPSCNTLSSKKSTYYTRSLQDLNIIEKPLFLEIKLAKYRYENPSCKTKIFTESIEDFATPKSRRTIRLNELLTRFALTESAESVSRKCTSIGINVSGDTLLRLSKKWEPKIDKSTITAIGIDDFAFKKNIFMER